MPVWWTKRSFPPSSGVMNPKPFSSLNHFTVPVAIVGVLHEVCVLRTRRSHEATCGRWHYDGRTPLVQPLHKVFYSFWHSACSQVEIESPAGGLAVPED